MFAAIKLSKRFFLAFLALCALLTSILLAPALAARREDPAQAPVHTGAVQGDFIRWVDFTVPESLLCSAMELDIETWEDPERPHLDWIDALAYLASGCGGDFSGVKRKDLNDLLQRIAAGETMESLTENRKYFSYYRDAYDAALGGLVGEYEIETENGWETRYGLKGFSPIAETFPYSDYDDFGAGRSYGYQRRHLGHDLLAATGTPVVAVESGTVEALGWNQYGGWRIGIRSFDGRRYHYYAHLRQGRPYAQGLKEGDVVMAGDVIGYVGRTGYSTREDVNNIEVSHLHYGLQLIFDESQKESDNEIWIDVYGICNLLRQHQSTVRRDDDTKEWSRVYPFRETVPEDRFLPKEENSEG